jgi:hypothetical protein
MRLTLLPLLSLLGATIAAPIAQPSKQLVARDGRLIQQAWTDIGTMYTRLETALSTVKRGTKGAFGATNVPAIHNDLVKLLHDTASVLGTTKPISQIEASALISPGTRLSSKITSTLSRITSAKPLIVSAGEVQQFFNLLTQQSDEYKRWSDTLLALHPISQKATWIAFSNTVIAEYGAAIQRFRYA